jgi:nucleotide-binding universal stress UspA family protein
MIRKMVVPVRGDGKGEMVLAHAATLAQRYSALVEVTHCRPRAEDLMPFDVPIPAFLKEQLVQQSTELADVEEEKLREEFVALTQQLGLPLTEDANAAMPAARWVEESGRQVDVIKRHGRLADLIVVAKPDVDRNLGGNTLKAALFHTARPVMMCPPTTPSATLGTHIAVAWNGSTEAARAVALTTDMLQAADTVTILSSGAEAAGITAADLRAYLGLRGVVATIDKFTAKGSVGRTLLERCAAIDADMMIMGAYGDSHERETIFGGNTQVVVDNATIPVVLVH